MLSKFQLWLLKRIFKSVVTNTNKSRVIYQLLRQAVEQQYPEDNVATIDDFLRQQFESTQWTDRYDFLNEQLKAGTARWASYNTKRFECEQRSSLP